MKTLSDAIREVDKLSEEDRAGLATHLLAQMRKAPLGPDDAEADKRDREMDSGSVEPISHQEFLRQVGRE